MPFNKFFKKSNSALVVNSPFEKRVSVRLNPFEMQVIMSMTVMLFKQYTLISSTEKQN